MARCLLSLCDIGKCYQDHQTSIFGFYDLEFRKLGSFLSWKGWRSAENERQKCRSINGAYKRIHEAQRPDDSTRVRRVLTARGKAVPHGAGERLVCHQPSTQCTRRVVKKIWQSANFGSLYLGHFLPDLDNSPLILFLLNCRRRNKIAFFGD